MSIFWLSFAGEEENLGIIMTEANTGKEAFEKITLKGLNPGGEVAIFKIPHAEPGVPFDKLLSREDLNQIGAYLSLKELPEDDYKKIMSHEDCELIHEECNVDFTNDKTK